MKKFSAVCTGFILFLLPALSLATLGEPIDSATKNLSSLKVAQKTGASEKYSVQEYEKNGNTVKEFANLSGVVFAVSWRGISKPDLNALFGSYFTEYKTALDGVPKQYGVKSISMKTSKMVIRRGGRMRDQRGFAYVPTLVPEGVNIEDLP
jgi:hypothetical protein